MDKPNVKITIRKNGSALVECDKAEIVMIDGSTVTKEGKFSLCRCGAKENKPFCDGAHKTCNFTGQGSQTPFCPDESEPLEYSI